MIHSIPSKINLKVNESACICVNENPSTGYHWVAIPDNSGVYQIIKEEYIPDEPIIPGSGGTKIFVIKGKVPGEGNLLLQLFAPGAAKPEEEYEVLIFVEKEKNCCCDCECDD